jgi:hypothetical protein
MATATDAEAAEAPDSNGFWTKRVYAAAALLFLLTTPTLLAFETAAGMAGGVIGGVITALAVAGGCKAVGVVAIRGLRYADPR